MTHTHNICIGRQGTLNLNFLITVLFEKVRKWKRIISEYPFAKPGVLFTVSFKADTMIESLRIYLSEFQ